MEVQPIILESIIEWFRKQAAERQTAVIIQAQIAVGPEGTQLLGVRQEHPLETIRY